MDGADQGNPDREGCGGDDADRCIGADLPPTSDTVDQQRGEHPPRSGPEIEVPPEDVRNRRAAEDRVRQPVADVRHALEDDVDADEPAESPSEQPGLQPMAEELV